MAKSGSTGSLKVTESYPGTWKLETGKGEPLHKTVGVNSVGNARGKSGSFAGSYKASKSAAEHKTEGDNTGTARKSA